MELKEYENASVTLNKLAISDPRLANELTFIWAGSLNNRIIFLRPLNTTTRSCRREFLPAHMRAAQLIMQTSGIGEAREFLNRSRSSFPAQATDLVQLETELLNEAGEYSAGYDLVDEALAAKPHNIKLLYSGLCWLRN